MNQVSETKFRAWNTHRGAMIGETPPINKMIYFDLFGLDENYIIADGFYIEKDTIVMEYIGLKDKQGIEKAAGDINRISWCNGFSWGTGFIHGVIEQRKGAWGLWIIRGSNVPEKKDFVAFYEFDGEPDEDRIVGNVYENPELAQA